jgi:DNA-binding LacI/PurR family transcriptional regulator
MNTLGIITNNQNEVFQRNVILGAREIAAAHGYDVIIDSYAENPDRPRPISLDYRAVSGVLIIANAAPFELLETMYQENIPVSLASHQVPGLPLPAVIIDNIKGTSELVRHLVEDCHRRTLVFIQGIQDQRDAIERETAFRRQVMRYDLPDPIVIRGDFSASVAARSLRTLLEKHESFDGVIAADYLMGIAAVETLHKAGYAVPEQISVVGFGDAPEAEAAGLTVVAADVIEQGRRTARQLISQIEGQRISGVTVLQVRLIVRDTSGSAL